MSEPRVSLRPPARTTTASGPFAALLELARARRVELTAISLADITDDYLAYIDTSEPTFEDRSEFVAIAVSLLLLKMWRVLAHDDDPPEEGAHLAERLRAYQAFLPAVKQVQVHWGQHSLAARARLAAPRVTPQPSCDRIVEAMERLQRRQRRHPTRHLRSSVVPLDACRQMVLQFADHHQWGRLEHLLASHENSTAAGMLLGALGLVRAKEVELNQAAHLGPLTISRVSSS